MARPKLGDSESKRLQMVITEDELQAIEDWRFKNRVQSKSDAIRRLVQIGIRAERALPTIVKDVADVLDMASDAIDIPEQVLAEIEVSQPTPLEKGEIDRAIANDLYDMANFTFNRQIEAQDNLFNLLIELAPFANNPKLDEAIKLANEYSSGEVPIGQEVFEAIGASRKEMIESWRKRRNAIRSGKLAPHTTQGHPRYREE